MSKKATKELIDKVDDEIGPYLVLLYMFPVFCSHLGFGGHLGLFWWVSSLIFL